LAAASFAQPRFLLRAAWRQHKDTHAVGHLAFHLALALHVDIEQKIVAAPGSIVQDALRGPVMLAEDLGVFQESTLSDHLLELVFGDEVVFAAVLLTATWRARGVRDREFKVGNELAEFVYQSGFSRAGRRRDDEQDSTHSRFCTCSRHFSISAFISSPTSVIRSAPPVIPEVFESSVLASRFISWRRKSSFLPTSPPWSSSLRKCSTCVCSRASSSWTSLRSAMMAASWRMRS